MKYRLKTTTLVDAVRWHKPGDHPAVTHKLRAQGGQADYGLIPGESILVMSGDWVISHANGRHQVLRDDVFRATYEPAEEEV
jgi:hypothetical protein